MPVSDQCSFEKEAAKKALEEAVEICAEAHEALQDYLDELGATAQDCWDTVGPQPHPITPDMDPMLVHVLEQEWDEYRSKVEECIASSSELEDKFNDYGNLQAACDIALEEADAIDDEREACEHALNEGIPFA